MTPSVFPTPDIAIQRSCSSLPCFPRTALLISPDGSAKASQRFVKFLGSLSPHPETSLPHPTVPDCLSMPQGQHSALQGTGAMFITFSPMQTHRAQPHMLLSLVKAQALLTPHTHSEDSGCGVLKRKSHSKILHNTPGAMPSRCIFK